jgi:hypothetical protein
MGPTTNGKKQ